MQPNTPPGTSGLACFFAWLKKGQSLARRLCNLASPPRKRGTWVAMPTELMPDRHSIPMTFVDEFIRTMKETYKNMLGSQKSGLDDVLKLTMDLVKYEVEQKIKGLREQIEAYKEIVDLKKKELDLTREQAKYEEGLADRVADIARLQAEIAQLSLDDSREAAALRAAKEKELADKQKELANYQDDHAYDGQIRALDDAAEEYEKAKQKEIEELEASISSAEKIYQMAVKRLEEDFWGLYQQVIDWNTEAGSSINKEITQAWEEAAKAVVLYGGYLILFPL